MKKTALGFVLTTLGVAVAAANSAQASELEFEKPNFTMFASLGVLDREDADYDPEVFELELGLKGLVKLDEFKMVYSLAADVADAANSKDTGGADGESDIHIRDAKVVFPTRYGAFVLAPRTPSGQLRELYSNVDLFEYNETHSGAVSPTGMKGIFGQGDEGQDVVAYVTPTFNNIKATMAMLSINETNGNDIDVKAFRVVYDDKKLNLGAGIVVADQSLAGADDDYKRMAFTAGYSFERFDIGATYEINEDTFGPNGDYDSYGVTGRYHFGNGYSVAAGYYEKDSDVDANDNDGMVFQAKKAFSKNIVAWAETGQYDKTADNVAVGVNIKF
ncbi:porin [Marinobacterium litorale]|uniref:porin n=1 Tax=Marinobacterium litorale TaxID=404770 RepID=UPI0003FEF330|nr:porin [Marinobacterium litorale]